MIHCSIAVLPSCVQSWIFHPVVVERENLMGHHTLNIYIYISPEGQSQQQSVLSYYQNMKTMHMGHNMGAHNSHCKQKTILTSRNVPSKYNIKHKVKEQRELSHPNMDLSSSGQLKKSVGMFIPTTKTVRLLQNGEPYPETLVRTASAA